jgi:Bacteriocin-protection, YdeI or OmpD-Associated
MAQTSLSRLETVEPPHLVLIAIPLFVLRWYNRLFEPKEMSASYRWGICYDELTVSCEGKPSLSKKAILGGVVHDLPADLKKALRSDAKALETWEDITPLARNEWICWIESAKKSGNKKSPDRMGLLQPQRWKAKTLLLAWLSASLRSSRIGHAFAAWRP